MAASARLAPRLLLAAAAAALLVLLAAGEAHAATSAGDVAALKHFKAGVTSDPAGLLKNWTFTSDPCDSGYYGITCSSGATNRRVTAIFIPEPGPKGPPTGLPPIVGKLLSEGIGRLTALTSITFAYQNFGGRLPADLGDLVLLTNLEASGGNFTDNLPNLSKLTRLTTLDLGQNRLSGSLPSWLNKLTQLTQLELSSNRFSGSIPDLNQLKSLVVLNLGGNRLSGSIPAKHLNGLPKLQVLGLQQNKFSGSYPTALRALSSVSQLLVGSNRLSGLLPNLTLCPSLFTVDLSGNRFRGPFSTLLFPKNISSIDASFNHLSGSLPGSLLPLPQVSDLNLAHNTLSGPLPTGLVATKSLQLLNLSSNRLSGPIPPLVNEATAYLQDNYFNGTAPALNASTFQLGNFTLNCLSSCPSTKAPCTGAPQRSAKVCTSFYKKK
eukprot:SM000031S11527  [mRNA]  locus=s31:165961:169048:- [translate_table: standard]